MAGLVFAEIVNVGDFLKADLSKFTETEMKATHVKVARQIHDETIASQGKPSEETIIVDGRAGAREIDVKPFGVIAYRWQYWQEIVEAALDMLQDRSPVETGEYRNSWIVLVNGQRVTADRIPAGTLTVMITNTQPYHRKIEVGAMRMRVPPHVVEQVRQEIIRGRFGNSVKAGIKFIALDGGYILKGHQRSGAKKYAAWIKAGKSKTANLAALSPKQTRRSKAFVAGRTVLSSRKDTRAGQPLTYPALVLTAL